MGFLVEHKDSTAWKSFCCTISHLIDHVKDDDDNAGEAAVSVQLITHQCSWLFTLAQYNIPCSHLMAQSACSSCLYLLQAWAQCEGQGGCALHHGNSPGMIWQGGSSMT